MRNVAIIGFYFSIEKFLNVKITVSAYLIRIVSKESGSYVDKLSHDGISLNRMLT